MYVGGETPGFTLLSVLQVTKKDKTRYTVFFLDYGNSDIYISLY